MRGVVSSSVGQVVLSETFCELKEIICKMLGLVGGPTSSPMKL